MKKEDLFDRSFVFDVYVFTTKDINPYLLQRKIYDIKNREITSMFWEECNDVSFYKHFWKPKNFLYLNRKNDIYPHVADFLQKYLKEDKENF